VTHERWRFGRSVAPVEDPGGDPGPGPRPVSSSEPPAWRPVCRAGATAQAKRHR